MKEHQYTVQEKVISAGDGADDDVPPHDNSGNSPAKPKQGRLGQNLPYTFQKVSRLTAWDHLAPIPHHPWMRTFSPILRCYRRKIILRPSDTLVPLRSGVVRRKMAEIASTYNGAFPKILSPEYHADSNSL